MLDYNNITTEGSKQSEYNTYVEPEKNYMSKYFTKSIKFLQYHNTHTESTNVLKVRILYARF